MDHKSLSDAYSSIYGEGFKAFPADKVAKQADKKPQTRRNQAQAVKMKGVADAHKGAPDMAKQLLKSVETHNRKTGLEKTFKKPAGKNAFGAKADSLEKQRRSDLDKRYGPKKEEAMRNIDLAGAYAAMYESNEQIDEAIPAIVGAAAKAAGKAALMSGAQKAGENLGRKAANKVTEDVEDLDEEGKKDACYHKVKSRYDVWPSAYASGALVKCRKAGAKNWGNKSKKEEVEYEIDESSNAKLDDALARSQERYKTDKAYKERIDKRQKIKNESYTDAYMEGYKKLPAAKMQDKAAMKPDTARGEKQARKMDTVRKATDAHPNTVKKMVKSVEMHNKKKGLERKYNAPSADNAAEKARKNKAYKLENQRRQDLNKRYGPKKEELEAVFAFVIGEGIAHNEDAAIKIINHMSDEWYDSIVDGFFTEGNADTGVSGSEAMKRHGIKQHEGPYKVKKLPARKARKGEGFGVGARKRQGAGKVSPANPSDKNPKMRVQ